MSACCQEVPGSELTMWDVPPMHHGPRSAISTHIPTHFDSFLKLGPSSGVPACVPSSICIVFGLNRIIVPPYSLPFLLFFAWGVASGRSGA